MLNKHSLGIDFLNITLEITWQGLLASEGLEIMKSFVLVIIQYCSSTVRDHSFSTYAKFLEN